MNLFKLIHGRRLPDDIADAILSAKVPGGLTDPD